MNRCWILLTALAFFSLTWESQAAMLRETYRGARAQAMGNAYVGLADDELAVWYNPAGLAGMQKYEFHYLAEDLTISQDTVGSAAAIAAIRNPSGDTLNEFMGKNIYVQSQTSATLVMPNFGFSVLFDGQMGLQERNKSFPEITLGYQTTSGFQAGYAFSTAGKSRRKKNRGEWRFGIGAKMLFRRGGYRMIPISQLISISQDTIKEIIGPWGTGYGVDLGTQYVKPINKRLKMSAGMALTDIGGTSFGDGPDPIAQNLSAGLAATYELGISQITAAYDWRHITDATDWRKKSHLGMEVALPFLSLYGGVDQTFITYGAGFDVWMAKLTALTYAEENGSYINQNPERRYSLRLDFKFAL